jgi:DNA end-binding protein Ku
LPRAYWNGFLKLSFVSCPVALYPATTAAERVSFRQVNRRTGHRLKHQLVDSVTGETVQSREKARGYEVGENRFLLVENRELEHARRGRSRPGAVQLAEPPRPASAATPASEPDEDGEAEEERDREDGGEKQGFADPVPRAQNTRRSRWNTLFQPGRSTCGISRSRITLRRATLSVRRRSRSSATR